jgi:hypothetical protein
MPTAAGVIEVPLPLKMFAGTNVIKDLERYREWKDGEEKGGMNLSFEQFLTVTAFVKKA